MENDDLKDHKFREFIEYATAANLKKVMEEHSERKELEALMRKHQYLRPELYVDWDRSEDSDELTDNDIEKFRKL